MIELHTALKRQCWPQQGHRSLPLTQSMRGGEGAGYYRSQTSVVEGPPEITRIQVHQGGSKWLFLAQCHRMEGQEQRVFSSRDLGCPTPPLPVFSLCSQKAAGIEPSSHCLGFLWARASSIRVFLGSLLTATLKIKVSCLRDNMT